MALTAAELAETTKILRQALDGALRSVLNVRGGNAGIAGGSGSRDAKAIAAASKANVQRLEKSSEKLDTFSKRAITANEGLKTFSSRMVSVDKIIKQLNGELTEYKKRIGSTKAQVVTFDFSGLTKSTDNTVASLDKLTTSTGLVKDGFSLLKSTIVAVERKVDDFGNKLESNVSRISLVPPIGPVSVNPVTITVPAPTVSFAGLDFGALNTAFTTLKDHIDDSRTHTWIPFQRIVSDSKDSLVTFKTALDGLTTSLNTLGTPAASPLPGLITNFIQAAARLGTFTSQLTKATIALRTLNRGGDTSNGRGSSNDGPPQTDRERQQAADSAASKEFWRGMKSLGADLWIAVKRMADDAYGTLAARGYGTTDAMPELYKDAMLAGMSLKEYAQFMDKNMIAVARASSFADFHKNLKQGTDGLKQFGVFGQDATNLAGTMMSTAVGMGVPQARLNDSIKAQTEAFAELRKGSNLTAEAFGQLISTIQDDEQLNRELANLSVDDRNARTKDIAISLGWAKQLGLSDNAIRSYTQAVLEHRKTTVKQRFEQAGRISQVGAMVGMGAEETDRMRVLAKNKYRTADEEKEFAILAGKMNSGLEKMQQGGPGSQFQSDIAREKLEQAGLGSALAGGTQINAGIAAGPTQNKDLNKKLSPGEQVIGESINTLAGAMKNPLAQLISVGASQLTAAWVGNGLLATIAGNGMLGGLSSILGKVGPVLGAVARIGTPIALAAGAIYGGYSSYQDYKKSDSDEAEGKEGAKEAKGKAKGEMYGTAAGAAVGVGIAAAVAAATGGIGLALSTSIISASSVVGRWLGGWIGGANAVETATEKLARELANNNKQLEKNTRATAGSSTVSADNLGNLTRNVAQTSKAFTAPTAAENKADFESKKTPEQKAADKAAAIAEYDRQMTLSTGFANGGKRVWEIEGKEKPVDPRTKGSITTPATTPQGVLPTNPMYKDTGFLKGDFFTKVTGATTAPTQTTTIATPPPVSQVKMGQDSDINKEKKKENVKTTETPPTSTSLQPSPVADASQILMQILEVLRSSLTAETMQAQLIRKKIKQKHNA